MPIFIQCITDDGRKFLKAIRDKESLENVKQDALVNKITDVRKFVEMVLEK